VERWKDEMVSLAMK